MQISAAPPSRPLPDLTIKKFEADHTMVYPGDDVTFTVNVTNQGNADAGPCNLLVDGDYNGSLKVRLQALVQGGSQEVQVGPLKISDWNEYQGVEAFADSDHEVEESKERNNKKSMLLYYPQPPGPPGPFPPPPH